MSRDLTDAEFHRFREVIYAETGIALSDRKRTLLANRLRGRLKALGLETFSDYLTLTESPAGKAERPALYDAVSTNETSLFRTRHHFDWLREDFVPHVAEQARSGERPRQLRFWSAAASLGDEAYSIGICLRQKIRVLAGWDLSILGTDLSADAISRAETRTYDEQQVAGLTEEERDHCFQDQGRYVPSNQVREMVTFRTHNLLHAAPESDFDCVFLRNVLIYFDADSKRRVVDAIKPAIRPGGFLVLGPSDLAGEHLESFRRHQTFAFQKPLSSEDSE